MIYIPALGYREWSILEDLTSPNLLLCVKCHFLSTAVWRKIDVFEELRQDPERDDQRQRGKATSAWPLAWANAAAPTLTSP